VSKLQVLAAILVFLFPVALFADQIVLKNGDRLTGSIEKSDDKTLVIKTEFAGEVTVQWAAVQEINSTQSLHVMLNNGQTVTGTVTTSDGNLAVVTANAGTVTEPKSSVTKLVGEKEQSAYEKAMHPGLLGGWQGGGDIGFALTRGNSQTKSLAVAFTADRKGWHDKLSLYTNSVYATNDAPGATPATTANAVQGGARYDHDLTARLFGYVGADFQTDALQTLIGNGNEVGIARLAQLLDD
jgi:small nuclear ribonucleoprotein (snRNP)-like protein